MGQTFSEGDTVRTSHPAAKTGTVAYGPYRATKDGPDRYMVQTDAGTAVSILAEDIAPYVTYEVGEEATERALARRVVIVAGPFKGVGGGDRYVVQLKNLGHHSWVSSTGLERVTPQPAPRFMANDFVVSVGTQNTYTLDLRTYDLRGEYADSQGDVWRFNGKRDKDNMPLMDCQLHPLLRDYPLSKVIRSYGPLSRA